MNTVRKEECELVYRCQECGNRLGNPHDPSCSHYEHEDVQYSIREDEMDGRVSFSNPHG